MDAINDFNRIVSGSIYGCMGGHFLGLMRESDKARFHQYAKDFAGHHKGGKCSGGTTKTWKAKANRVAKDRRREQLRKERKNRNGSK